MFSKKLLLNLLRTSFALSGILIASSFTMPAWAMDENEIIESSHSKIINQNESIETISEKYMDLYNRLHSYTQSDLKNLKENHPDKLFITEAQNSLRDIIKEYNETKGVKSRDELSFLSLYMDTLNVDILSTEEWNTLRKVKENSKKPIFLSHEAEEYEEEEFFGNSENPDAWPKVLTSFIDFIDKSESVRHDDTIVAVGNTPQIFLETLKYSQKELNLISLAISKHPGFFKSQTGGSGSTKTSALLSPKGLKNYRQYLKNVGLDAEGSINHKRVFFLDYIVSGFNVEFVITQFLHSYVKNNKTPPDIYVMPLALNNEKYFKNPKYVGKFLEIKALPQEVLLDDRQEMEECILKIDGLESYSPFRITPNFSADFWHEWPVDSRIRPIYNEGGIILENINKSLKEDWELPEKNKIIH